MISSGSLYPLTVEPEKTLLVKVIYWEPDLIRRNEGWGKLNSEGERSNTRMHFFELAIFTRNWIFSAMESFEKPYEKHLTTFFSCE